MTKEKNDNPIQTSLDSNKDEENSVGYPYSPESEDIYNNYEEEKDIDPEDIFKMKESVRTIKLRRNSEFDLDGEFPGDELDVPGAELDDEMEVIGSEDEENNYYSLGDDEHDDPEEDQGE